MPFGTDSSVTVNTSRLDRILRNLDENTHDAVRAVAFAVQGIAQSKTAFDTGALRSSIYTRIGNDDGYAAAAADAKAKAAQHGKTVETAPLPKPENNTTAHVGPSVEYGIYQEFGTRYMRGQPYMVPAINQVSDDLERNARNGPFRRVVTDE